MMTLKVALLERAEEALDQLHRAHVADGRGLVFTAPDSQGLSVLLEA